MLMGGGGGSWLRWNFVGADKKAYARGDPKLNPWATSSAFRQVERPKAEALGYLEAKARARQRQQQRATADPYGMTNKRTSNSKNNGNSNDKSNGKSKS
jgi:hypothetical protein